MKLTALLALGCTLFLAGCGYQFQGGGSILPPDVKRIYVPLAENFSTEPGLSLIVTEAIRDRFERFGVLTVVDERKEADAILKLVILNVKRDTSTTTSNTDTALEVNTSMTIAGELRKTTGGILWRNAGMTVSKPVGTTGSVVVTTSSDFASMGIDSQDLGGLGSREVARGEEQQAFEQLAVEAARKIYEDSVAPDF